MVVSMLPWSSFISGYDVDLSHINSTIMYTDKVENASIGDAVESYNLPTEDNNVENDEEELILEDYIVPDRSSIILDKDIEVASFIMGNYSNIDLNGHTIICHGDFIFATVTALDFNNGEIICLGDFTADRDSCQISMTHINDHLVVDGRLTLNRGIFSFTNGIIEANGDVNINNYFTASNDNVFIFSGNEKQVLSQTEGSSFASVILKNYSEEGLVISNSFNYKNIEQNGCRVELEDQNGVIGYALTEDEEKDGLFILSAGTLDLNGHTLTINGDFIHSAGKVKINNGQLIVNGSYRIQKRYINGDNVNYSTANSLLEMNSEEDRIRILNDFVVDNSENTKGLITNGQIEVSGNICIDNSKSVYGFYPTEDNEMILSSEMSQKIEFKGKNNKSYSNLHNLTIINTSEDGVSFDAPICISGKFDTRDSKVSGDLNIVGDVEFVNQSYIGNVSVINSSKISGKLDITGDLNANASTQVVDEVNVMGNIKNSGYMNVLGSLTVSGDYLESYTTTIYGSLKIGGDYKSTKKDNKYSILSSGTVTVENNIENIIFRMDSDEDSVYIGGNYTTAYLNVDTYYNKGSMEIKGDIDAPVLRASSSHKLILSGDKLQTVTNADKMTIGILELNNKSEDGVIFDKVVSKSQLIRNDCRLRFGNLEGEFGWTLEEDEEITGDLVIIDDELNLNGHKLHVTGDLIQMSGIININGGELNVDGDYRMQSKESDGEPTTDEQVYGMSASTLCMVNENDKVTIKGNFYVQSSKNNKGKLTDGELILGGSLIISNDSNASSFSGTDNFKLILNGVKEQNLQISNHTIRIPVLEISGVKKVTSDGIVYVDKELISSYEDEYDGVILIKNSTILTGDGFKGSLKIYDEEWYKDCTFSNSYHIGGDFYNFTKVNANEGLIIDGDCYPSESIIFYKNSSIGGNLINKYNYTLEIVVSDDSILTINGNLDLKNRGYVSLRNGKSVLKVKGDFSIIYNPQLSTGELYIGGDFNSTSFNAINDNKVILDGDKLQTMNVSKSCKFATLELNNTSDEGVISKALFKKDKFIKNDTLFKYDGFEGVSGYKLTKDEIVDGDFVLLEDTLDLNGHKLTVNGDFIQLSGAVNINEGSLIISGDYRRESSRENNVIIDKTDYTKYQNYVSDTELIMQHENDYVEIGGDFIINTSIGDYLNQTDGIINLKGNLIYFKNTYSYGFHPVNNLCLKLSGDGQQELRGYKVQYGQLYNYQIQLASLEIDTDDIDYVLKGSGISISNSLNTGNAKVETYVNLLQGSKLVNDTYYGNLTINTNIDKTLKVYGNVAGSPTVTGILEVNGTSDMTKLTINSGKVDLNSTAKITNIAMNGGELNVSESLSTNDLKMTHDEDRVTVDGDLTIIGGTIYHSELSGGQLYVGGNLNNSERNIISSKKHRTVLNGTKKQIINCPVGKLGKVELKNYSSEGIYSDSVFKYQQLIKNGCKLTYGFEKSTEGFVLDGNYTHTGNLVFIDGEIDLNGHTLTVEGDLIHVGGTIKLNGGKLIINKDLREQSPNGEKYIEGQGTLSMTSDEDIVIVNGDCYLDSDNISEMKTGSIYVKGDLRRTIGSKNFDFGTLIVLDSDSDQSIDAYVSGLANALFNTKGKLTIRNNSLYINKYIKSTCKDISGNISVKSLNVIESPYYGDVVLRNSDSLSKDIDIIGTLSVDNRLEINGKSLNVDDFVLDDEGFLIMNNPEDYISVSHNMVINPILYNYSYKSAKASVLSDGIIEIYGEFDCQRDNYFVATDNHRVIFYPMKRTPGSLLKQRIAFGKSSNRTSRFNILELKGSIDNYKLDNEPDTIANEIISESSEVIKLNPVTDLKVKNTTVNTVTITFTDTNTEYKASGYEIYRNGVKIGVTDRTEYTDRNLKPFTQYTYSVCAFDSNKNLSDKSISVSAQTLNDTEAPTTPQGLHISNRTGANIMISWTGARDNIGVKGYIVYRNGEPIADRVTGYEYTDNDVIQDMVYTYEISAIDAAGNESSKCDSVSAEVTMPEINRVTPADYKKIGGDSVELKAYYKNYGSGSRNIVDFEYQNADNEWIRINDAPVGQTYFNSSEYVSTCNWSIGHLESGSVNVRFVLSDASGAKDEFITEYEIDHTAPDCPENIEISDDNGVAVLTWKVSGESDFSNYNIYRYVVNEGDSKEVYSKISEIKDKLSARYEDNTVETNASAKYIVTAVDDMGNESALINPVSLTIGDDEIAPAVTEISPDEKRIAGKTDIAAYAKDNKAVSDISFYILPVEDKDDSKQWKLIDKIPASIDDSHVFNSKISLDTTEYPDGEYYIAAKAYDYSGNESTEEIYRRYEIDNLGIQKININKINAGSTYIQLMWDDVEESDFGYFLVEQKSGYGFKEVARVSDITGCTVENLVPESMYTFRVCGVDLLGNKGEYSDDITAATKADTSAPSITAVYPVQGRVRDSIPLRMKVTDNFKVAGGTWSLSFDGNEYEPLYTAKGDKATVDLSYKLDVSDPEKYPEGKIYIKSEAEDVFGNKSLKTQDGSDIVMEYIIDRTAPVMIQNVSATAHDGYIEITWNEGTEEDISRYKVYRADAEKNNYKCVMDDTSLNFYDTSIEDGESYSYYVTAVDEAGNESEISNITYATAIPDETAPKVAGVSPLDGNMISASQQFQIIVTDNSNLINVKTYYRVNENDGWSLLSEDKASGRSSHIIFNADFRNEEEGDIFFKTICEDKNGNVSDDFLYKCRLDKTPPKAQIAAEGGNFEINIDVKKDILEQDISYCEIYRCELSNSSKNIDFFRNATSIKKLSLDMADIDGIKQSVVRFTDTDIVPHTAYRYAAKVYDKVGNYSWTEIVNATATSIDDKAPSIVAPDKITTIVGMEVGFDAGDSTDNVKIKSFAWNLGNGDTAVGARPKYRYNTSGKYAVKLTVTDASGNSSEKDIEVQVKEASNSGICNLTVVDYQGNPIPYAYVYVKAGADSNTTFMTDAYGKISLCYKSGTYTVAAYKEGYLPEEQEYTITNMKTTEEVLKLSSGEVVVGKFEVQRMSLQEIIDSGVDISNPANLNTFTFKTTLTFEKKPIPISVDYTPGDIMIIGNSDSGHAGGSTESHFGDGKGKPDIVPVASYLDQVVNNVPAPAPVPVIAIMTTTQTVSWLKTMYSANLTIMNAADSQYVINDAKGRIELPDGVSFAVLGEDKRRETGTASGQSEVIDMGDIAGQEQKTVSWILKGDRSGKYQVKAKFDGLLTPFNVPVEKTFIAEQEMETEQADVDIVVMPESALYLDEDYYVHFSITNKGNEPLYNFTTSIGDYRVPNSKSVVYTMNPDSGNIEGMDISGGGMKFKLPIAEQIYHMPVLSGEDQISIPTLLPGQTIMGTWKRGEGDYKEKGFGGDSQREYFQLINTMVEVLEGENLGVHVYVKPIGSHVSKLITTSYKEEDVVINLGDPVDMTSGAFLDTYNAVNLTGNGTLSYDLSYDSVIAGDENIDPDGFRTGMGWTGSFDSHIVEQNGLIKYYTNPYAYTLFITDDSYNGKLYGYSDSEYDLSDTASMTDADSDKELSRAEITLVEPGNTDTDIRYVPVTHGMEGFSIIWHDDGLYTLISPIDEEIDYDNIGRIQEIRMSDGSVTDFSYSDNTTKIEEVQSGNSIIVTYDNEKIASVSGGEGRTTSFEYDNNGDLVKIIDTLGNAITYEYDDNHHITAEKNTNGETFISNIYDESGRVITQTDSYGAVISFNYYVDESGNLTVTAVKRADGYPDAETKVVSDIGGHILDVTYPSGAHESYSYYNSGNVISVTNGYGNKTSFGYDSENRLISSNGIYGRNYSVNYDDNGNIISINSADGNNGSYTYDENGNLISSTISGATTNYIYASDGTLSEVERVGKGSRKYVSTNGLLNSSTDELGYTNGYKYDKAGNLTELTDPYGNKHLFTYNAMNQKTSYTDALGNTTQYTYDSYNNITSETDPLGNTYRYEYDVAGNPVKIIRPDGSEIKLIYDMAGNMSEVIYPDGSNVRYNYDLAGNNTGVIYPDGSSEEYSYDKNNNLISSKDRAGNITEYGIDSSIEKPVSIKDIYDNVMDYGYDSNGYISSVKHSQGFEFVYDHDKFGNVKSITDSQGHTTEFEYNEWNELVKEKDYRGNITEYFYDAAGNCIEKKLPTGLDIHYTYDKNYNVIRVSTVVGDKEVIEAYTYDGMGNMLTYTDTMGRKTSYTYDKCNRLLSETYPDGIVTTYSYDNLGNLADVTSSDNTSVTVERDSMGRIISVTQNGSEEKSKIYKYTYDQMGQLVSTIDPMGKESSQTYDVLGNVLSTKDADGGETVYTYDKTGNLLSETNSIGYEKTYKYDSLGRPVSETDGEGREIKYTYDSYGRLIKVEDTDGSTDLIYDEYGNLSEVNDKSGTIAYSYDNYDRITEVTDARGKTVKYAYDEIGNIISLTYPGGEIVRYEYNPDGSLATVTDSKNRITKYTYDSVGRLIKTEKPDGSIDIKTYNESGYMISEREVDSKGEVILNYEYGYDSFGNITSIKNCLEDGEDISYSAESMGIGATVSEDGDNIVTNVSMEYNSVNQLIKYNGNAIKYDKNGNMIYGPLDGEMTEFEYDSKNRLIRAGDVRYTYDADGVRISAETDTYIEYYVIDRVNGISQILQIERFYKAKGDKNQSDSSDRTVNYYYGNGLVYEDSTEGLRVYHYDHQGSIRKITDDSGEILYNFTYGTYGELLSIWHKGDKNNLSVKEINKNHPIRFLYNGALGVITDDNTLCSMRQRYYNTEIKRFINQDIVTGDITNSQSLNRYAYVQGNPVNYNDPFGLSPMKILQAAFTPVHDILNIAGIVPGPIGTFADLGNAFLYSLEGNSSMASKYVVQAFVTSIAMPLGGTVIGTLCGSNKAVKIMVGLGIMGAGAYSILTSGQGLLENFKELKNEFSKEDRDYLKILHYGSGVISNTAGVVYGINSMYGGFTAMFGKCFVAGTKIKTEDGEKNIEDIEAGDQVYSYNPETGEEGYKTVKQTFIKETDEIVHVTVSDTSGKDTVMIDATPGHPFYVVGYGFKYASELKIGDKLRSVSGDIYEVIDTEVEHFGIPIKVYNFEVEDWHTYAVSEVGIFVHNSKGCGESTSNEQTTEQPSEPQPNTGTAQATTTQQGTDGKGGSNYYQDANGRWHRPNGQFASNGEVGLSSASEHYLHRPYIRQSTIDGVNANTKVNYKTGQIYDSISKKWVNPENVELGHVTDNEYWYLRDMAESQGMTQAQFNDFMNNSDFYAWQEIYSNRSHMFENPH